MYKFSLSWIGFAVLLFLSACQSKPITVSMEKTSLSFTGRGSSAALMLDSVLPGGLAIGIAIDEGIAKSIEENIRSKHPEFNISNLINSKLKSAKVKNIQSVIIKTYGFKSSPGEDQVSAWLVLELIKSDGVIRINYPDDFADIPSADFSLVKSDASTAIEMLATAVERVIAEKII